MTRTCIFTVDVEDWFHILDTPAAPVLARWYEVPSRVEHNFVRVLDLLSEHNRKATCFFLAWVAQRYPALVQETVRRGHEVASHGFAHLLAHQCTRQEFLEDARTSREILEDISGKAVLGYRAAGFSVTEKTDWFFDVLIEAGYRYDSSVFPGSHGHGGLRRSSFAPYVVSTAQGQLVEFPVSVAPLLGQSLCFSGGGYLRLLPYPVIRRLSLATLRQGRPVMYYVHPREIDPDHPRLPMTLKRRFKSYVNLRTTEGKLRKILSEFDTTTCAQYVAGLDLLRQAAP